MPVTLRTQDSIFFQYGKEETTQSGELLVEIEPIRYELTGVKLNWPKKRNMKRTPRVLAKAAITNARAEAANMAEACTYSYNYSVSWGRRHAMLTGHNTSITLVNGTSLPSINWNMPSKENRTDAYK